MLSAWRHCRMTDDNSRSAPERLSFPISDNASPTPSRTNTHDDEVLHVKNWAGFQAPRFIVGVDRSINKACPIFRGQMRDNL